MKITIDFGRGVVKSYLIKEEVEQFLNKGGAAMIQIKHPHHADFFICRRDRKKKCICK